jgi:hypothetical protein
MAPKTRRQLGILVGLAVLLVVVLVYNRDADPLSATTTTTTTAVAARTAARARAGNAVEVDVVHLDALTRVRPEPQAANRNPFRFHAAAPPPSGASMAARPNAGVGGPAPMGPPVPMGPPPLPPIALKFIGVVEQAPSRLKLAVLSDGRNVFYGKEGDTIEGRYRIERIGVESIEMAYIDGRGRQTLRLSGS